MPTRQDRRRKDTEPEEITQNELQRLADLDEYISILQWYRKRASFKLAARIEHGAAVEDGRRRAVVRNRQVEVR